MVLGGMDFRRSACLRWLVIGTLACACDSGNEVTRPTSTGPSVTEITITGLPPNVTVGQSSQLTASVTFSDGTKKDATSSVAWQSSDATVATVSSTGLLTMTGAGEALLSASLQGVKGTAKLLVSKLVPPLTPYEISGVVHESAPTENVLLPDAVVQVVGGKLDGQQVSTNASGAFTLPPVTEAGFSLRVKRAGYETLQVPIDSLPHHLTHSIGLLPLPQEVHEQWKVECCGRVSIRELHFSFPVHHSGKIELGTFICVRGCLASEGFLTCAQLQDDDGKLIAKFQGFYDVGIYQTIDIAGGHHYDFTVSVCPGPPNPYFPDNSIVAYTVDVTRPN
jgi:Bacterial Ig-like domain (group 2)